MISSITPSIRKLATKSKHFRLFTNMENDMQYLVLNALGEDRTGIVADMTKLVTDNGGSVSESKALKLGSHFSLMMLVSCPKSSVSHLKDSLGSVPDIMTLAVDTTKPVDTIVTAPSVGYAGEFKLSGADNPGIVYKVTQMLADHSLSIDNLSTAQEDAPFGGTKLFIMEGKATANDPLPKSFDPEMIQEKLTELGNALNCDITLEDIET